MNISGDYAASFEPTTERLMTEAQKKNSSGIIDRLGFKRSSIKAIAAYLVRDLSLGSFEGREWLKRPASNLRRLVIETASEEGLPMQEFVRRLGNSAVNSLLGEHQSDDPDL